MNYKEYVSLMKHDKMYKKGRLAYFIIGIITLICVLFIILYSFYNIVDFKMATFYLQNTVCIVVGILLAGLVQYSIDKNTQSINKNFYKKYLLLKMLKDILIPLACLSIVILFIKLFWIYFHDYKKQNKLCDNVTINCINCAPKYCSACRYCGISLSAPWSPISVSASRGEDRKKYNANALYKEVYSWMKIQVKHIW